MRALILSICAAVTLACFPLFCTRALAVDIADPPAVVAAARELAKTHASDVEDKDRLHIARKTFPSAIQALNPHKVVLHKEYLEVVLLGGGAFGRAQTILRIPITDAKLPFPEGHLKEIHPGIFLNDGAGTEVD